MIKKLVLAIVALFSVCAIKTYAQECDVFQLLDLDRPGLEKVKKAYAKGDNKNASTELLNYFRDRKGVVISDFDFTNVKNSKDEQRWADESLEHKFYAHRGYQSYFYGDDIDWKYWPVKDNELRWQLHRHYWFVPLAKAYYVTKDDKYIDAWMEHYKDWIAKNPLIKDEEFSRIEVSSGEVAHGVIPKNEREAIVENMRFAWRPLEISRRMQDQIVIFALTIDSPKFTPEFLDMFLCLYYTHADFIMHNFSKQGNHLLFEAQRMIYAGTYFPEFKDASAWRKAGIELLNREINIQVREDGVQFELDPGYHTASINIFLKAIGMLRANGLEGEFPKSYIDKVERMIEFTYNLMYPDYTTPMFGDHKLNSKSAYLSDFKQWSNVFSENAQIKYFASEGKKGKQPEYLSNAFKDSGFFIFRDGWLDSQATVMIVKAGPPAYWHNQPDNGTFELWRKGRNFFMDSGCFVYGGNAEVLKERAWFRQTRVHNTLTLDERDLEVTDSKLLCWNTGDGQDMLVTENKSYKDLKHRRSVFYVNKGFFVVVDEASGEATGDVAVHFNLIESEIAIDKEKMEVKTLFGDGNNISVRTFAPESSVLETTEGWISRQYRQKNERPSYEVKISKKTPQELVFISVILPSDKYLEATEASYKENANGKSFEVVVDGKKYVLEYML